MGMVGDMSNMGDSIATGTGAGSAPLIGNMFTSQQEKKKIGDMQAMGQVYNAYRPEMQQARMDALRQQMGAYQGANNVLASMYGPQRSQAPQVHNPMPQNSPTSQAMQSLLTTNNKGGKMFGF